VTGTNTLAYFALPTVMKTDFMVLIKVLIAVHLEHSSFWPSADVKPM
jgi:hypothetical protein